VWGVLTGPRIKTRRRELLSRLPFMVAVINSSASEDHPLSRREMIALGRASESNSCYPTVCGCTRHCDATLWLTGRFRSPTSESPRRRSRLSLKPTVPVGSAWDPRPNACARRSGVRHAFATANGGVLLHLLLAVSGLGPGDEVIVPSITFVATVNAFAYTGATPILCEFGELSRPWITDELVEPLLGPRTKAILTIPCGGHPGATAEQADLAGTRSLLLLVDAAHAVGARAGELSVAAIDSLRRV
jgi:hypothetical protein